jgi:hypothetical protein
VANWDWVTISALATAFGTLVLAVATFASVRSGNRSARNAERSLLQGLRPLLFPSRLSDEPLKVFFQDDHWVRIPGGQGSVEASDEVVYLALSVRNVGSGLAVLDRWFVERGLLSSSVRPDHSPLDQFRRLTRDLYVPPGDIFFWQGALRDPAEPIFAEMTKAVLEESPVTVELLYADEEGGQRTVTRFSLVPRRNSDDELIWLTNVSRHWNIDRADPR